MGYIVNWNDLPEVEILPNNIRKSAAGLEDLTGQVEDGTAKGDWRDALARRIRFADRIHVSTGGSPSYPDHLIELFQRKRTETIYDQIVQRQSAAWKYALWEAAGI
ncbi:hypothetical protein PZ897_12850 [Hoeflea sp. YIM 152468]|uniref:hypothetical protein n=1 Tax=Hoeflea sp. YIM 152468 TaxID=3031759 RepID=UPI0023DAE0B8|nr:hypothetical protein [Hoeflea sp. YIM 152468]MDF1609067.1 hypothetical protein [Hoeflea sp. YIM 152468]